MRRGHPNSSLSHILAISWPRWFRRAVRNRHRDAIEQATHRWRGGRREDSGRSAVNLISTQVESLGGSGDRRATDRRIMTADRAVRTSIQESDAPAAGADVYLPLQGGGGGGGRPTPEEAQALQQAGVPPDRYEDKQPVPSLRIGAKAAIGRREHQCTLCGNQNFTARSC